MSDGDRAFPTVAFMAALLVMMALLAGCGSAEPTAEVLLATATSTPMQEVVATNTQPPPPSTETPTSPPPADTPTIPPSTDIPELGTMTPTAPSSTDTPIPDTATPTLEPTDTPTPETPTTTPTKRPTNTPEISYPPPTLLAPREEDAGSLRGQVTFVWSYPRALEENEAFQVLAWKEGDPHWGIAGPWTETEQTIDLDGVLPQRAGTGEYFWTVVVLERGTERILSPEAPPWRLNYLGPWDPCAACDCNSQCRQGNCAECCFDCCGGCE
jgi:hypothetical protein